MVERRAGLRIRTLLGTALVVALGAYLGLDWWIGRGGGRPPVSWLAAALPALIAAALWGIARRIRAARAGRTSRPIDVIGVYRSLLFAQACALTAAVLTGWYLGYGFVLLPDADVASIRGDLLLVALVAVAAALMAAAGLAVQRACRLDPPEDPEAGSAA